MRLGTCVVLELVTGAITLAALSVGSVIGVGELQAYLGDRERAAEAASLEAAPRAPYAAAVVRPRAEDLAAPPAALVPDPPAAGAAALTASTQPSAQPGTEVAAALTPTAPTAVPTPAGGVTAFAGMPDDELLAPLRDSAVVEVKLNRGGSSLSLRLDLEGGGRAAFKPEQIHPQSMPRKEIAAYRLDRWLGIGRVSPAIARKFRLDDLIAAAAPSSRGRVRTEAIAHRGWVTGELSWWIAVIDDARINGFRMDETAGIVTWRRYLKAGATVPEADQALVRQISDMVLFDFLIDNIDRWSGSNAKISEDHQFLYFMDNTLSFSRSAKGNRKSYLYLDRVQTFSRKLVTRMRALSRADLDAMMVGEPDAFPELLTEDERDAVLGRRDRMMVYIDGLIATHGEDVVLAFP